MENWNNNWNGWGDGHSTALPWEYPQAAPIISFLPASFFCVGRWGRQMEEYKAYLCTRLFFYDDFFATFEPFWSGASTILCSSGSGDPGLEQMWQQYGLWWLQLRPRLIILKGKLWFSASPSPNACIWQFCIFYYKFWGDFSFSSF